MNINYQQHQWDTCGDLKVIGTLERLQGLLQSIAVLCVYGTVGKQVSIPTRKTGLRKLFCTTSTSNVKYVLFVNSKKVRLHLYIKLGLTKNFVKEGNGFKYLKEIFPQLTLKEGILFIFIGSQITKFLNNFKIQEKLDEKELAAWKCF